MAEAASAPVSSLEAPWSAAAEAVTQALATDPETGLAAAEAERRLAQHGRNEAAADSGAGRHPRPRGGLLLAAYALFIAAALATGRTP